MRGEFEGSEGFLLAAEPETPTREIAARLSALEKAGIVDGIINVKVAIAPIVPRDPAWLAEVSPRINPAELYAEELVEITLDQLEIWEPLCGNLGELFATGHIPAEHRAAVLAGRFVDAHRDCGCRTSADRWAALFHLWALGVPPVDTTNRSIPVTLSSDGVRLEFRPDESWQETIRRLPEPGAGPTPLLLVESPPGNVTASG
jgi:hypothetical protein